MSHGQVSIVAPHICGEPIPVVVYWDYNPGVYTFRNGDPGYPPTYDEEWKHNDNCPKCGVALADDTIFQATVTAITSNQHHDDDYQPGDEIDYEPDEDMRP